MKLKLRAWDEIDKVMHYDFEYISSGDKENGWIIFESDKQPLKDGKVFDNPYPIKRFKIMQYIGVNDYKNEKELYEKELIKDGKGNIGVIYYRAQNQAYEIEWHRSDGCCFVDNGIGFGYSIGNIFENPEIVQQFSKNLENL